MLINQLHDIQAAKNATKLTDLEKYARTIDFRRKLDHSLKVLSAFLEHTENPVVSCGGGKDGTAVALLVQMLGANMPVICANPPNPLPDREEHKRNLKKWLGVPWHDIDYSWDITSVLDGQEKYPDGLKIKRLSEYQREHQFDGVIFGIRAAESRARSINLAIHGEIYRITDGMRCQPISKWTAKDSLCLALLMDAPINPVYQKMDGISDLEYLHDGTWWPHGKEDKRGWIKRYYPDFYDLYLKAEKIKDWADSECRF